MGPHRFLWYKGVDNRTSFASRCVSHKILLLMILSIQNVETALNGVPLSLLFGCYRFLLSRLSKSILQIHNTCAVLECTMGAFCTHITDANSSPTVGTMTQTLCITDKLLAYVCTRKDYGYVTV